MLTVTVNDRPLDVAAIVEHGRVLLPMRATFAALGASVGYDPRGRVIVARSALHALRLQIGAREAVVDGHSVRLDVPAQIVADSTYVPLRFVAQAMGAAVGYDAAARLVTVAWRGTLGGTANARAVSVVSLNPAPQSTMATAYPTISASLGTAAAARSDVTLTVDGEDVTALASFDGTTITYMPRAGLARGNHTVMFYGKTAAGQAFSASWSFETTLQAPPDAPASFQDYGYQFYASGPQWYHAGDWMHFVLVAPPGGSAELDLCGLGYQYALFNSGSGTVYEAHFPAPYGYWIPSCNVTAVYTAWNGRRYYVPTPVIVGLFTRPHRHPRPKPTPTPIPIGPGPRHPEPTPSPIPAPLPIRRPQPAPTARPIPTPHPEPIAHPEPRPTYRPLPRIVPPIFHRPSPLPRPTAEPTPRPTPHR